MGAGSTPRSFSSHHYSSGTPRGAGPIARFSPSLTSAESVAKAHTSAVRRASAHVRDQLKAKSAALHERHEPLSARRHQSPEVIETDDVDGPLPRHSVEEIEKVEPILHDAPSSALIDARHELEEKLRCFLTPSQHSAATHRIATVIGAPAIQSVPAATANALHRFTCATSNITSFLQRLASAAETSNRRMAEFEKVRSATETLVSQINMETKKLSAESMHSRRPSVAASNVDSPSKKFVEAEAELDEEGGDDDFEPQNNDTFASLVSDTLHSAPPNDTFASLHHEPPKRSAVRQALVEDEEDDVDLRQQTVHDDERHFASAVTPDNDSWGDSPATLKPQRSTGDILEDFSPRDTGFAVVDFSTPQMTTNETMDQQEASL